MLRIVLAGPLDSLNSAKTILKVLAKHSLFLPRLVMSELFFRQSVDYAVSIESKNSEISFFESRKV